MRLRDAFSLAPERAGRPLDSRRDAGATARVTFLLAVGLIDMKFIAATAMLLIALAPAFAGDNLRLNSKLDYTSDSQDGPLVTGDRMDDGFVSGKPAYVILSGEGCYNSKRQARRTVSLYEKYKGRVQFVIVDLDRPLSAAQQELRRKYYQDYIPHVVVLDASGAALYNSSGEVDEGLVSGLLDKALR